MVFEGIWDEGETPKPPGTLELTGTRARIFDTWDPYHTKEEHIAMFKALCDAHPTLASYETVGTRSDGTDMWLFKIGNPNGGKVLWDAQLHGIEDVCADILYLMAGWLLESGEERAQRILQGNYVYFIPVVSPTYQRGNANHATCQYGVNLNRNFKAGWRTIQCEPADPPHTDYSGTHAASETETQILRSLFATLQPAYYVNMHQGAGPYARYHSAMSGEAQEVVDLAAQIASQMGITLYPSGSMGSTGFAIGDASSEFNIPSWLIEAVQSWRHDPEDWNDLVNLYYPKNLVLFIAQCELCESVGPPPTEYTLTISTTVGGTTSPAPGSYSQVENTTVQVTGSPSTGYNFDHWILDGVTYTTNPISVLMDTNHTLTAYFSEEAPPPPETYKLNIATVPDVGTTDPMPGLHEYDVGTSVTVTAIPDNGYYFDRWQLDGVTRTENPINILMNQDHTIVAVFSITPPPPPPPPPTSDLLIIAGTITVTGILTYLLTK